MIKKLNAVLLVLVVTMLAAKFAVDQFAAIRRDPSVSKRTASSVLNAGFAPRVIYKEMVSLAMRNPITRRDGYIIDFMEAVFPKGRFEKCDVTADAAEILKRDPHAVCVISGDRPALRGFPRAATPITEVEIVVYTLRTLEWTYTGPESLAKIKVGIIEGYEDCSELMKLYESSLKTDNPMAVIRPSDRYYRDPLQAVLDGIVDAVVMVKVNYTSESIGVTADTLFKFNVSPAIERVKLLLTVSNADPEYARRLIDAYESGYKTLEESGVIRRIREYYRIGSK